VECLGLCVLVHLWLLRCRRLALRNRLGGSIGHNLFSDLGNGVAGVDIAHGGEAAGEEGGPYSCGVRVSRAIVAIVFVKGFLPVRRTTRRVSARVQAIVEVCGVEIVGCLGDQDVAFIEVVRPEVKWRANHMHGEIS
jgi:hypothetical protein